MDDVILGIPAPYLMIFALCLFMLFLGMYSSRKERGNQDIQGFLVANRKLPTAMALVSMTATWVGGGYINGTAEAVFDSELGFFWAQAPFGYALSLIIGGIVFAPIMRRKEYTTLLDPFEKKYGEKVAAILFIPALIGEVFWSAAILVALGTTCGLILDLDFQFSIIISSAVVIAYTMLGGLYSVAFTDMIQLPLILIGLLVAIPPVMNLTGGLFNTVESYAEICPPFPSGGMQWQWGDMLLLLIFGGIPWQSYMQRVLACKTPQKAGRLSIIAGVLCFLMAIPPIILGLSAAVVDWGAMNLEGPPSPALVLPYVLKTLTSPAVSTVALGAIIVAVMSSVDSSILAVSSLFIWNVYRPLFNPGCSSEKLVRGVKISVLGAGILATALALTVQTVYGLWVLSADLVYVILFPQLVIVLFSARTAPTSALVGISIGFFIRIMGGEVLLGIPSFAFEGFTEYPFRTFAMLSNLMTTYCMNQWFYLKKSQTADCRI
ncbi:MAG: high affinity choline transporter 7 [Chlamydiales bacterium]|jgi:high affinity choline transporter 7